MALLTRFQTDADAQLAETTARTVELRALNEQLDTGAREEAAAQRKLAEDNAHRIVRDAEKKAKALVAEATKRTRLLVSDAEDRLGQIRIERDAVAGYFESLRSVLTQAERVNDADK